MTLRALQVGMNFMSKRSCRGSSSPGCQCPPILNPHGAYQLLVKVGRACCRRGWLVTGIAGKWQRREFALLVVAGKAASVSQRSRLECPLLQPESIADLFGWLRSKFIIRLPLRLVSLVTILATRVRMLVMWEKDAEI